ncbi:hypothetical protein [Arthrobacter woluwensis]|uniref:Predicted nucleotidyltransferase n=1 Tax=Arthrobacter woluwensis TaxID=156980 RepID=A0A1H4JKI7_9MICC|nr:hypothetical protein [Arthrobacter woluwensis]SEB46844.1 Predicted nucleotidyltransferase [Arthrobacter woluwensis]
MLDLSHIDSRHLATVTPVVTELRDVAGLEPDRTLLVGAACKDILHAALGHSFPVRGTSDIDVGIAVNYWGVSKRIETSFARVGSNGIRYLIGGIPVDVMPFGAVEDPAGISQPAARKEDLVVFGFRDVYERALPLRITAGSSIRIPRPAGYAALKMRSWIDRSTFNEYKDARDLPLVAYWYRQSSHVTDRLYDTTEHIDILESVEFDTDLGAIRLLARDVADQLSSPSRDDLARRWAALDLDLLAREFNLPDGQPNPSLDQRRAFVDQLKL